CSLRTGPPQTPSCTTLASLGTNLSCLICVSGWVRCPIWVTIGAGPGGILVNPLAVNDSALAAEVSRLTVGMLLAPTLSTATSAGVPTFGYRTAAGRR